MHCIRPEKAQAPAPGWRLPVVRWEREKKVGIGPASTHSTRASGMTDTGNPVGRVTTRQCSVHGPAGYAPPTRPTLACTRLEMAGTYFSNACCY